MKRNARAIAIISGMLHLLAVGSVFAGEMKVEKKKWGATAEGEAVALYTLSNSKGMTVRVMTYGATLVGVDVPDRDGKIENVTLYLDTLEEYLAGHPLLGSVVGRYANRIGGGGFTIDGERYDLETVNAKSGVHIHGGKTGFQKQVWNAEEVEQETEDRKAVGVRFSLTSPDGHEGYPGTVKVAATYWLSDDNELGMEYEAETDKPTHVNLTNHAYWNLAGAGSGDVLGQELEIKALSYLEFDRNKVPTGNVLDVKGTPLDFLEAKEIGERIGEVTGGYDHCYVLDKMYPKEPAFCARAEDPVSGRVMEVFTTQSGLQLYTANGLSEKFGGGGKRYGKHHGFCLETQAFPDTPNQAEFPGVHSTLLRPGEKYRRVTMHRFSVVD